LACCGSSQTGILVRIKRPDPPHVFGVLTTDRNSGHRYFKRKWG
jgi:hypothetical protein